jgi:hypothetical protein
MPTGKYIDDPSIGAQTYSGLDRTADFFVIHDDSDASNPTKRLQASELMDRTLATTTRSWMGTLAAIASVDLANDELLVWDNSAGAFVRMTAEQVIGRVLNRANITGLSNFTAHSSVDVTNDRFIVWDASGAAFVTMTASQIINNLWNGPHTAMTTTPQTLASTDSGKVFSNTGAALAITVNLPAATVGLRFSFVRAANYNITLDGNGSETINGNLTYTLSSAGRVDIECYVAGTWVVTQDSTIGSMRLANVRAYGALGDGSANDTPAFTAAIASGLPVFVPAGTYQVDNLTLAANQVIFGTGYSSLLRKRANGALLTIGRNCEVRNLYIDGAAYSGFTGSCISIPATAEFEGQQLIADCWIHNADTHAVHYTAEYAGYASMIVNCRLGCYVATNYAVKWGVETAGNHHGYRFIINCRFDQSVALDCRGSQVGTFIGCHVGGNSGDAILYDVDTAKIMVAQCRFTRPFTVEGGTGGDGGDNTVTGCVSTSAINFGSTAEYNCITGNYINGGSTIDGGLNAFTGNVVGTGVTVNGDDNVITGNNLASYTLTLASGAARNVARSNIGTVTDSSGSTTTAANLIDIEQTSYSPTWTAATTNPVLNNGTLAGYWSRQGRRVLVTIRLIIGSTTTLGSGVWYFSLPWLPSTAFAYFGTGVITDNGTSYLLASCETLTTGAARVQVYADSIGTQVSNSSPLTWATGDEIRLTIAYDM